MESTSDQLKYVLCQTFVVGCRLMHIVHDPLLVSLASGCHNTQFVIISCRN